MSERPRYSIRCRRIVQREGSRLFPLSGRPVPRDAVDIAENQTSKEADVQQPGDAGERQSLSWCRVSNGDALPSKSRADARASDRTTAPPHRFLGGLSCPTANRGPARHDLSPVTRPVKWRNSQITSTSASPRAHHVDRRGKIACWVLAWTADGTRGKTVHYQSQPENSQGRVNPK